MLFLRMRNATLQLYAQRLMVKCPAGFKAGWNMPTGTPSCNIWHQNQPLAVESFGCMCLGAGEMQTLTAHASVDKSCDDTCAAGELASGVGVKTDNAKALGLRAPV